MTPTKQQWYSMLREARKIMKNEEKIYSAYKAYMMLAYSSSYAPINEHGEVSGYLIAVEAIYGPSVSDAVSYWLYDVPSLAKRGKVICNAKGKTYDARDIHQYVAFCMSES